MDTSLITPSVDYGGNTNASYGDEVTVRVSYQFQLLAADPSASSRR